jgi:hypothetical protein
MADYIRKSTLCQAYVRVDKEFNLEDLENDNSELILEEFAKKRASFLLYKQVQTKVKFKKGSTISGALYLLYQGIAQYPDFRTGLNHLVSDIKMLAESLKCESLMILQSKGKRVIRTEARIGLLGSIQKIVNKLDRIRELSENGDSIKLIVRIMDGFEIEISRMFKNLHDSRDRKIIKRELLKIFNQIKNPPTKLAKGKLTAGEKVTFNLFHGKIKSTIQGLKV